MLDNAPRHKMMANKLKIEVDAGELAMSGLQSSLTASILRSRLGKSFLTNRRSSWKTFSRKFN